MTIAKRLVISGVVVLGVAFTSGAAAQGIVFMPVLKDDYKHEGAISLMLGTMEPTQSGADSSNIIGVEYSFRCVLLQAGDNQLRQQLSYTTWEKDDLTLRNLEINAHYQFPVANGFKIGVGPGVGLIMSELDFPGSDDPTFLGVQLGVSAHYTAMKPFLLGAEYRQQLTTDEEFVSGGGEDDMNNWRLALKAGYMF